MDTKSNVIELDVKTVEKMVLEKIEKDEKLWRNYYDVHYTDPLSKNAHIKDQVFNWFLGCMRLLGFSMIWTFVLLFFAFVITFISLDEVALTTELDANIAILQNKLGIVIITTYVCLFGIGLVIGKGKFRRVRHERAADYADQAIALHQTNKQIEESIYVQLIELELIDEPLTPA